MSLGRMLTKVAIGFAVAKGVQAVAKAGSSRGASTGTSSAGGGLGDIMGQLGAGKSSSGGTGGLGDIFSQVGRAGSSGGGLGDIMGQLGGKGGGLGDMLGKMGGGSAGGLGGLGGLIGGLAATRSGGAGGGQSLEDLLSQGNPVEEPEPETTAGLMIRAMIMAARCDNEIDPVEKETILATIGEDASPEDMQFVQAAMSEPVSPETIARDTPTGLETQVYSMSVMAIDPDNQAEAQYLHSLAMALQIGQATVNEIHDSFGVPRLYS